MLSIYYFSSQYKRSSIIKRCSLTSISLFIDDVEYDTKKIMTRNNLSTLCDYVRLNLVLLTWRCKEKVTETHES